LENRRSKANENETILKNHSCDFPQPSFYGRGIFNRNYGEK
jgi:hypothetical protein